LVETAVRSVPAVVGLVLGKDGSAVSFTEDQEAVQALAMHMPIQRSA